MSFHLGNPAGLWALLAIPVVVLIHCLQQKTRRVRVSTLFLLQRVAPESASGSQLERFRQSLPFWMQILATLLLTWMLAEPRWMTRDRVQDVAVVLDQSASMSAYKAVSKEPLLAALERWKGLASQTRWHLLSSESRRPTLYSGEDLGALAKAYDAWQPRSAMHDPAEALAAATGLVPSGQGAMLYMTDHPAELPANVAVLSVAEPMENVGFTGLEVKVDQGRVKWQTLVKNSGAATASRKWQVRWAEAQEAADAGTLSLPAGGTATLKGELPPEVTRAWLELEVDAFPLDDKMPLMMPESPTLSVDVNLSGDVAEVLKRMLGALPETRLGTQGEVTVAEIGQAVEGDAIYVDAAAPADAMLDTEIVAAENHPLVKDLNWSPLITPKSAAVVLPTDTVLLWRGSRALIYQRQNRTTEGRPAVQLYLHWDLLRSNAQRVPAVLVMLHRWMQERREAMVAMRRGNYETHQRLELTLPEGVKPTDLMVTAEGRTLPFAGSVPENPGFFQIGAKDQVLVEGAAHFADVREADLSACSAIDSNATLEAETRARETQFDPMVPLWTLALLGALLTAWGHGAKARQWRSLLG
jgi:hypothetical protein